MSLSVWPWRPSPAASRPSGQAAAALALPPLLLSGLGGGGGWASAGERLGEVAGPSDDAAGPALRRAGYNTVVVCCRHYFH